MQTVAILGVGLIGGSFALALRRAGFRGTILGCSSPATLQQALAGGVIDEGCAVEAAVPRADLVYLAQPVGVILESLPLVARLLKTGALATDAGSTKQVIVTEARRHFPSGTFLGGHPMAGKASRGVASAEASLFEGRPYLFTPAAPEDLESAAARELQDWVVRIGARVGVLAPAEHDRLVAASSHLPQLVSTLLSAQLEGHPDREGVLRAAGPGLLGMTRLAQSDWSLWHDILATNEAEVRPLLETLQARIGSLLGDWNDESLRREFAAGREFAENLRGSGADERT